MVKSKSLIASLAICLMLVFVGTLSADETVDKPESDWALKTFLYQTMPTDSEAIVQTGKGLQISLHRKNLYLYLSRDVNQVRFAGQGGPDVNLWSLGVGMQHRIGKHLNLSVDVGWYEPKFKKMGEPQDWNSSAFSEGLLRYLNKFLAPENQGGHPWIPNWDYYSLKYYGSVGGKLNLSFEQPLTENITFNITAGYRYLKLLENVKGEDYDGGYARLGEAGCWTIRKDRDWSSFIIGGMLEYKF